MPATRRGSISAVSAGSQFLGDDDGAGGQLLQGGIGRLGEVADEARPDHADILAAGREIGVVHRRETGADAAELDLDRAFGIDAFFRDAPVGAAHQTGIGQHRDMGVEQITGLLRRGARQPGGFRLQLVELFQRQGDGVGEALALGLDLGAGDTELRHGNRAIVADERRSDGDAGRDGEAGQDSFVTINLHRSRFRSAPPARRAPVALAVRLRATRSRSPVPPPASSAP